MKVLSAVINTMASFLITQVAKRRAPDFTVGDPKNPYLHRWWVIPRNSVFNVYLHKFLKDDDDRALHDHPWHWCSILLRGGYVEFSEHGHLQRHAPSVKFSGPRRLHRIKLLRAPTEHGALDVPLVCWTLFITGPRLRKWGFSCDHGWVPWDRFTAPDNPGAIGPGCNAEAEPRP